MSEYGETRRTAIDGFERYRAAGVTLGAAWPGPDDARAAAVQPLLGVIAASGAEMERLLAAQEDAHARLDDAATRATWAADRAASEATAASARAAVASAAADDAGRRTRVADAAATAAESALAETRVVLATITAPPTGGGPAASVR
jgi:hypothetical protein